MAKKKEPTPQQKKNQGFKSLFNFFRLSKKKQDGQTKVYPGAEKRKKGSDEKVVKPIEMNPSVQKAWDYFESNATVLGEQGGDYSYRIERYKELEYMVYNEGLMWTAVTIYSEEAVTEDEQGNIIGINAKKKEVEKNFYNWMSEIGLNSNVIRNISWNLTVYADDFLVNAVDLQDGVTEVTPLSPFMMQDRLEFSPVKTLSSISKNQKTGMKALSSRSKGLEDIADLLTSKKYDDYNSMYKSYLLGFIDTGGNALPPWNVTHFRRYSNHSEFAPYGRPLFIGSLARYKSFKATELLVDSARQAMFPKEHYTIKAHEDMTEVEMYQQVNRVREMIQNINQSTKQPDESTLNEPIFSIEDLYDYNLEESRIDLESLGDMEAKRKDLIMSTGIPPGYLEPSDRGWGNSGQNLLQQSKIFARRVYATQSAILEQIAFLYRMHLMVTEQFEKEDTDFELYMHYPVVEENSDKVRLKSDSISLASSILSDLGDAVGLDRGEALPIDIVKQVFSTYTFLDPDDIESWIDIYQKSKEEDMEESRKKEIKEKVKDGYLSEEVIQEVYFMNKKRLGLKEGSMNGKHYYTSNNRANKLNEKTLTILKEEKKKNHLQG